MISQSSGKLKTRERLREFKHVRDKLRKHHFATIKGCQDEETAQTKTNPWDELHLSVSTQETFFFNLGDISELEENTENKNWRQKKKKEE